MVNWAILSAPLNGIHQALDGHTHWLHQHLRAGWLQDHPEPPEHWAGWLASSRDFALHDLHTAAVRGWLMVVEGRNLALISRFKVW